MKQSKYLYVPDGNKEIYDKLVESKKLNPCHLISDAMLFEECEVFFDKDAIIKIIKDEFNPLLDKQNILLIHCDNRILETISYVEIKKEYHVQMLMECADNLSVQLPIRNLLHMLLEYMKKKDILDLKEVYEECRKQNIVFDTLIIKKIAAYLSTEIPDDAEAHQIMNLFQNMYQNKTDVIVEKTDKKYNISDSVKRHMLDLKTYKRRTVEQIENHKQKKNLIVFHMESISNEIFTNHRYEFRDIEKIMSRSLNFGKFYSSATSSAMAISDFIHGNDFEMDRFTNFHEMMVDSRYGKGLYQLLEEQGYVTLGIGYNFYPKTEEVNSHGIWTSKYGEYRWIDDFEIFMNELIEFIDKNKNNSFAIHVWNLMPHVGQKCMDTEDAANFYDRINMAYESLNMTMREIYDILKKYQLLDKTVVAGYGDHGDDKWTRSMNAGFTHTIEPYHNIINTPAFIYDSRLEPMYSDELVSLVDMKRTLCYLTGNEIDKEFDEAGINIFQEENDYVFSKRLFANQHYYEEIKAYTMMKLHHFSDKEFRNPAYAIIGRKYTLIVSNYGCEMFMNQLDPFSYNNVLNFYEMDDEGNLVSFHNRGAWRGHFRTVMMRDEQIYDITFSFYEMREKLIERIKCHEKMVGDTLVNRFDEKNFRKIRRRGFIEE